jgi:hypothetical protein
LNGVLRFAPLFSTPLPGVGIAPPSALVLVCFLTAQNQLQVAAAAGIAAGCQA